MNIQISYQDPDLLVVEKPIHLHTIPDLGKELAKKYPELQKVGGDDWGAVHRLDFETSGLVVLARNQKTYEALREAFSKNRIKKEYLALVEGKINKAGEIDWPIGPDPKSEKKVKVYRDIKEARRQKAQEALTLYTPLFSSAETTTLQVQIKTGRRHQIRAHFAALGHPIVGDSSYGGKPAPRLFLHAARLGFDHPTTGKEIEIISSKTSFEEAP